MATGRELPIPSEVATASSALEVGRIWVADGAQHVALATGLWSDPDAWGLVLADLARHIARAYEQTGGPDQAEALARIRTALEVELGTPTDDPEGGIVN